MPTRAIMIQGTGSNVGKSMLVAGLCRAATRRGLSVAPFKPQNMSNNAAVTEDGGEIGRAQALQAIACGRPLSVHMNPILLKPETDSGSQVIVQGQRHSTLQARDFSKARAGLMAPVLESFGILGQSADLIIVEGAGSPAETNLRQNDLANMGFARAAGVPVVLAGDINRGGVIAQIVGTQVVMDPQDAAMITGFLVNKFRGDVSLFDDGYREIERRTGWTGFGTLPWFANAHLLPAEDAVDLSRAPSDGGFHIVCPMLSRISNFDDLDPLSSEPGVQVEIIPNGRPLPGDADMVLIPGSKATIADLEHFRTQGWDIDLAAHIRRGGHVLGLCGGYQMLGRWIDDPEGIEGRPGRHPGLGHLDIETVMTPAKRVTLTDAVHPESGAALKGYEIHLGRTTGPDCARAWLRIGDTPEGASSPDGRVRGCYLHGLYASDGFRAADLARMGAASGLSYEAGVEEVLDALAAHVAQHIDLDALWDIAAPVAR